MSGVRSYEEQKTELEARTKALEEERATLLADIPRLEERVTILRLEDKAKTLQGEVSALRAQKYTLENEIAQYSSQVVEAPPQTEIQVVKKRVTAP